MNRARAREVLFTIAHDMVFLVFLDFKLSRWSIDLRYAFGFSGSIVFCVALLRQRHAMFHELFLYVVLSANTCAYFHDGIKSNRNNQPDPHFFIYSHLLISVIRTSQSNNSKLTHLVARVGLLPWWRKTRNELSRSIPGVGSWRLSDGGTLENIINSV